MDKHHYTPMMQQYLEIKEDYADAIVFFRLGDFYEMFFDDAIIASKILEIALTARDAGAKVPMCGVPFHSVKPYIQKLIEKGHKIALVEQVTEPGKGLVKREVVRLITPGTVYEEGILDEKKNNYIGSVTLTESGYALSYLDLSTGEAFITDGQTKHHVLDLIFSHGIKEVVCPPHFDAAFTDSLKEKDILVSTSEPFHLMDNKTTQHLNREQKRAASHLIHYLMSTQKQAITHLMPFEVIHPTGLMRVDYRIRKHLEIDESQNQMPSGSLIYWLDHCQTAMGSRMLRSLLLHPIRDLETLNQRYDLIDAFSEFAPRQNMLDELKEIYDINRIVGRIAFNTVNARDLVQLKETLRHIPRLKETLKDYRKEAINQLADSLDDHLELFELLEKAIHPEPPISIKEGGIIRLGYHAHLDELKGIALSGETWLKTFEDDEREKTGIRNLKVGYNRVFGYYIEISRGNTYLVKPEFGYERKQTLTNSERYISPILKQKEDDLLHAKEKSIALEYDLFKEIREIALTFTQRLQVLSTQIAKVDVFLNLAILAQKYRYTRPKLRPDFTVKVHNGRHPVVEHFTVFVENNVLMEKGEMFLITGPNMSGKSTFMRMYAMMVYMAQIGSFVPAESAELPIYDALFTRIGSSDDLSGGKSTFMVEMVESNEALKHATDQSLILFDEIGRGTATYDGMALAQGMIEYIHEKIKAHTFFSTHYHELTVLDKRLNRLTNLCVKAQEENEKMVFLHHVERGTTDKSYGIQVASLAHLPKSLIARSKQILAKLENKDVKISLDLFNYDEINEEHTPLIIDPEEQAILEEIKTLQTDQMTPIDALLLIKHYQRLLKKTKG